MTNPTLASATIYEFPVGGSAGRFKVRRLSDKILQPQAPLPTIMPESGWYHDVAMQDEGAQKN